MTDTDTARLEATCYEILDGPPDEQRAFLTWIVEQKGLPNPPYVLDVGCGPGRTLPMWADLGWPALAMEPYEPYYELARERAASIEAVEVRAGGLGDIEAETAFDLVVALNGPFSYLLSAEEREDAARRLFRALSPGGIAVLDMGNFQWILEHYEPPKPSTHEFEGGTLHRSIHHAIDWEADTLTHTDRFRIDWDDGRIDAATTVHRIFMITPAELERVLERAGFVDLETYDGMGAREPGPVTGSRLIAVGRR